MVRNRSRDVEARAAAEKLIASLAVTQEERPLVLLALMRGYQEGRASRQAEIDRAVKSIADIRRKLAARVLSPADVTWASTVTKYGLTFEDAANLLDVDPKALRQAVSELDKGVVGFRRPVARERKSRVLQP